MQNRCRDIPTPQEAEEEDAEFERMMALSDQEMEDELQEAMEELQEHLDRLTPDERYRDSRRTKLGLCISWRKLHLTMQGTFCTEMLKKAQWGLWNLRYWRRTGIWPGSDS